LQTPSIAAGYVNACGAPEARAAVAKHHSHQCNGNDDEGSSTLEHTVPPDDVIIANGASGALELALSSLLDKDTILLVPRPGFPLYQVIAESHGARVVHYDLLPDNGWECDLQHIEDIAKEEESYKLNDDVVKRVRGIVINNPSNPTGAVYSRRHLESIVRLAERYQLPIVADEIYGDLTFDWSLFHPMAMVAMELGGNVPVITASGLGKQCEYTTLYQYVLVDRHSNNVVLFAPNRLGSRMENRMDRLPGQQARCSP
jgi:tyrosine aminotransferase